ncbi:hypothetical protein BJF90_00955 [Pseudonocardia sp. CNS-004]|nr:hypothetical protein BJF90_00955 [Pseudonocardia sp. CNS-004]
MAVCVGGALTALDLTIVNVALPQLAGNLGTGLSGLQWVVNAYTLAFASLILTAGALSDRLGDRPVFGSGVALFTIASAGCGLAPSAEVLIAARAVQGIAPRRSSPPRSRCSPVPTRARAAPPRSVPG